MPTECTAGETEVTRIPTWIPRRAQHSRLESIGASTIQLGRHYELPTVKGLRGSIVVGVCNSEFFTALEILRGLDCRLVWVNSMTYVEPREVEVHQRLGPFDAYIFESRYQFDQLTPIYRSLGASDQQFHRIRSPCFLDEFPFRFRAHEVNEPFVVGRIARPDPVKWSADLWSIYGAIRTPQLRARVMAWTHELTSKCGAPPPWAEALRANAESSAEFLTSLHCLLPVNGGLQENWPRVGLEAMACGVPIVAEDAWGWQEMIEHGKTGFRAEPDKLPEYASLLAEDDNLRLEICRSARARLASELANTELIWQGWESLLQSLSGSSFGRMPSQL